MVEFKVQLDDKLVQTIGYSTIEKYLNDYINQIVLKISAQDALEDLKSIHLDNDSQWKIAREQAWKEQGYSIINHNLIMPEFVVDLSLVFKYQTLFKTHRTLKTNSLKLSAPVYQFHPNQPPIRKIPPTL